MQAPNQRLPINKIIEHPFLKKYNAEKKNITDLDHFNELYLSPENI